MRVHALRATMVVALVGGMGLLGLVAPRDETRAASGFAAPPFEARWKAGEALTPNFWGPLANAKDGRMEPYGGAERRVQYFDKGRMELDGTEVTSGLLASEIVRGRVQVGTAQFEPKTPPAIPVAGDAANPGPTYAAFTGPAASLLAPAMNAAANERSGITTSVEADGTIGMFTPGVSYSPAGLAAFDDATKHNVARAFVTFRERVGLLNVGYAIAEPFWANLLVGGERKAVLVQVFERRVLTYTPTNPAGFEVEMGNIGQHYHRWRYETSGPQPAASVQPMAAGTATTTNGTPMPTATTGIVQPPRSAVEATVFAVSTAQAATATAMVAGRTAIPGIIREEATATINPAFITAATVAATAAAATPAPSGGPPTVAFPNPPTSVSRGSTATLAVNTVAGAYCIIGVTYANGPTRVDGLQDKTADANGRVSWSWRVGSSAATGNAPIEVTCSANGQKVTATTTTYVSA